MSKKNIVFAIYVLSSIWLFTGMLSTTGILEIKWHWIVTLTMPAIFMFTTLYVLTGKSPQQILRLIRQVKR